MQLTFIAPGFNAPDLAHLPIGSHMPVEAGYGLEDDVMGLATMLGSIGWTSAMVHLDDGEFGAAFLLPIDDARAIPEATFGVLSDPVIHGTLVNMGIDTESLFVLDTDDVADVTSAIGTRELHTVIGEAAVDALQSLWQSPPPPAGLRTALKALATTIAPPAIDGEASPGSGTSISAEIWG